jgi:hypothetical protein
MTVKIKRGADFFGYLFNGNTFTKQVISGIYKMVHMLPLETFAKRPL